MSEHTGNTEGSLGDFTLDFEKTVHALETQITVLKQSISGSNVSTTLRSEIEEEIQHLEKKIFKITKQTFSELGQWERVQLARHPFRPQTLDYVQNVFTDFHEIKGDRLFADDPAMLAGFAYLDINGVKQKVVILGIQKGRKTKDKIIHNFGMPRPEGYRKAQRVMQLAHDFSLPLITFIDTPGAYPGIDAEERGQAQAIAASLQLMSHLNIPTVAIVIGEGGSGGALAIGIADRVLMQEFSVYSVISPESCASILWSDPKLGPKASEALKLGPHKAFELKLIDGIIEEPLGGAHRSPEKAFQLLRDSLCAHLTELIQQENVERLEKRYQKLRNLGCSTLLAEKE
jgi:acetyl-CoA carboxylase carboxyl transferase subunit alpha